MLAIFDLDGTLCDTVDDIARSVNAVLRRLRMATIPRDTVRGYVGRGARALMERCLGDAGRDGLDRAVELLLDEYKVHCLDRTRPYPGVREGLKRMAGLTKVILSNKPRDICRITIDGLGLASHFAAVYGGESLRARKPDPEAVREVLSLHGADPGRAVVVGDSEFDLRAARGAGVPFLGVTYGYGSRADLEGAGWIVDSFEEVSNTLLGSANPTR